MKSRPEVNGESALAAWDGGTLIGVAAVDARDGLIVGMRAVVNPEKLEFVRRQLGAEGTEAA
ncbi:hypothetical protein AB0I98_30575 [Streptomyces sp. NPDC050211]|uniref:hypothetical protein n=1 Tax=Streptomyces sp. NPDC050211 TaxID=3154932 RepID=UPI003425AD67